MHATNTTKEHALVINNRLNLKTIFVISSIQLIFIISFVCNSAFANCRQCCISNCDAQLFLPQVELNGKIGYKRNIARTRFLFPIWQTYESLIYSNTITMLDSARHSEVNLGIGIRKAFKNNFILGAYGFGDMRKSRNDKAILQGTLGGEFFTANTESRANVYLPLKKKYRIESDSYMDVHYDGPNTSYKEFALYANEYALHGFDVEVGGNLPQWERVKNYLTYYHFQHKNVAKVDGFRVRSNIGIFDWLAVEGEYSYDNMRKKQFYVGLKLKYELLGHKKLCKLNRLYKKMVIMPERDIDIVTANIMDAVVTSSKLRSGHKPLILPEGIEGIGKFTGDAVLTMVEAAETLKEAGGTFKNIYTVVKEGTSRVKFVFKKLTSLKHPERVVSDREYIEAGLGVLSGVLKKHVTPDSPVAKRLKKLAKSTGRKLEKETKVIPFDLDQGIYQDTEGSVLAAQDARGKEEKVSRKEKKELKKEAKKVEKEQQRVVKEEKKKGKAVQSSEEAVVKKVEEPQLENKKKRDASELKRHNSHYDMLESTIKSGSKTVSASIKMPKSSFGISDEIVLDVTFKLTPKGDEENPPLTAKQLDGILNQIGKALPEKQKVRLIIQAQSETMRANANAFMTRVVDTRTYDEAKKQKGSSEDAEKYYQEHEKTFIKEGARASLIGIESIGVVVGDGSLLDKDALDIATLVRENLNLVE